MAKLDCNKCGGEGNLFMFSHVKGGVCFSCKGTGKKHTKKRIKIISTVYAVSCEEVNYKPFKTEKEALEFSEEVQEMHLEKVTVLKKETYTYKFELVAA